MDDNLIRLEVPAKERTNSGLLKWGHAVAIRNLLVEGGFALIPSDTCYALAALPTGLSMSRITNQILNRSEEPISLAFDSIHRIQANWAKVTPFTVRLLEGLTPGPLTVVCPLHPDARPAITDDVLGVPDRTLGVRIPDSQVELQLVGACDSPMSTVAVRDPATKLAITDFARAREVVLGGLEGVSPPKQVAIVEATQAFLSNHSTVVRAPSRVSGQPYEILRRGAISEQDIAKALGQLSQREIEDFT